MTQRRRATDEGLTEEQFADLVAQRKPYSNGEISISTRGIRITGRQMVTALIVIAVTIVLGYAIYAWRGVDLVSEHRMRQVEHEAIVRSLNGNTEAIRELSAEAKIQSWLMSRPPNQRPELVMPPGIAERIAR